MIIRPFHQLILAVVLISASMPTVRSQSTTNTDPLRPYTTCKLPADLKLKEVRRMNPGNNYREVLTANGKEKVSVIDGYRVMFAYTDLTYYFANVKIEQSISDSYAHDKEILISQLTYQSTPP